MTMNKTIRAYILEVMAVETLIFSKRLNIHSFLKITSIEHIIHFFNKMSQDYLLFQNIGSQRARMRTYRKSQNH